MVVFFYVVCPNEKIAKSIAEEVISKKLAACANLFTSVSSYYCWKGKCGWTNEAVLVLKTSSIRIVPLMEKIKSMHPDEVPCIECVVTRGTAAFEKWVESSTRL